MANYYIATTGNDTTGNGSSGNPWATISKAVASSTAGDTIVMAAGTYTQSGDLTLSARTYRGAGFNSTIIDFASGNYQLILNGTAITIQDLQVANITRTNDNFCIVNQVSSAVVGFTRVWFKSLVCGLNRGVIGADGAFGATPSTITLTSCIFSACALRTTGGGSGHFCAVSGTSICTMINCIVYSTASAALSCNVVSSAGTSGKQFVFKNCILYTVNSVAFTYNNLSHTHTGSVTNCVYGWSTVPAGVAASITSDPLFIDAAGSNFNLRPTSPCINTGTLV